MVAVAKAGSRVLGLFVAAVVVGAACGGADDAQGSGAPDPTTSPTTSVPVGRWRPIAESPLAPRVKPLLVGAPGQLYVLGGSTDPACIDGPACFGADATEGGVREAAVYDVAEDEWRRIADPPLGVGAYTQSRWVAGRLLVDATSAGRGLLVYDSEEDRWSRASDPPPQLLDRGRHLNLSFATTDDDRLYVPPAYAVLGQPIVAYDPVGDRWEELPADPLGRAWSRHLTRVGDQLVLAAHADPTIEGDRTDSRLAMFDPATSEWRALPDAPFGFNGVAWFGLGPTTLVGKYPGPEVPAATYGYRYGTIDTDSGETGPLVVTELPDGTTGTVGHPVWNWPEPAAWHWVDGDDPSERWLYAPSSEQVHRVPSRSRS